MTPDSTPTDLCAEVFLHVQTVLQILFLVGRIQITCSLSEVQVSLIQQLFFALLKQSGKNCKHESVTKEEALGSKVHQNIQITFLDIPCTPNFFFLHG